MKYYVYYLTYKKEGSYYPKVTYHPLENTADPAWIAENKLDKEGKVKNAGLNVPQDLLDLPDAIVRCDKQNNGEFEPMIYLWFDRDSCQFLESRHDRPKQYVNFEIRQREVK